MLATSPCRFKNWLDLARIIAQAEMPDFDLVNCFAVLTTTEDTVSDDECSAKLGSDLSCATLEMRTELPMLLVDSKLIAEVCACHQTCSEAIQSE